ncbi:hypothetical protein [Tenacibaculum finnmarkense]|uniref:hypothetical protein n=1 Tax=Tenacibaculum finnmarkense TaxID=2781243 RepID=UPI001E4C01AF|nr:hypothetical protein [Tenacibaculum finnmarkense]MCD8410902.1 hypothetical protein [Tenacibaculum finnmarkense genomovar ulcerans]
MKTSYSLILGGYVNGYSIIQELHSKGLKNIALFDYGTSISSKSNKINYYDSIDKTSESLKKNIFKLLEICDYIVIFPTDDLQLENLHKIFNEIKDKCFVPFNYNNIISSLDKDIQYKFCEEFKIPYPKSIVIEKNGDLIKVEKMMFPVLIKPNKRKDATTEVFRSLFLNNVTDFENNKEKLLFFLSEGIVFLVSEFIPGDDTHIYSYVGYRNKDGKILNEWIGKKLNQYPDKFGVFSSGSNQAPKIIQEQGAKLLNSMNLMGICQPEFKYDNRDGKYKLMEINLRSMMWNRVGNLLGVNIQYTQFLDATNQKNQKQSQKEDIKIHFVYLKHEVLNLIFRKKYWKFFKHNLLKADKVYFAVYNKNDLKPFLYNIINFCKTLIKRCLKL